MSGYAIALFLHIVGALGIFVALGLEWTGLRQMRSAMSAEPVRAWMGILQSTQKVGFVSMLAAVVSGVYMMATAWGGAAWLIVTLASLVLVIALSAALTRPRMAAMGRALAAPKWLDRANWQRLANHPLLWASIQTRVAIALAIIFLKIAKPDLGGSLAVMGVAIVLGLASALPLPRRGQVPAGAAD
jgi:hypothetical protein